MIDERDGSQQRFAGQRFQLPRRVDSWIEIFGGDGRPAPAERRKCQTQPDEDEPYRLRRFPRNNGRIEDR